MALSVEHGLGVMRPIVITHVDEPLLRKYKLPHV